MPNQQFSSPSRSPALPVSGCFGPLLDPGGASFRLWAPSQAGIDVVLADGRRIPMSRDADGFWSAHVAGAGAGTRYRFSNGASEFPDPASRLQDGGTHGWSVVTAPPLRTPRPNAIRPWTEAVLCEVHVGTVTPEGTFAALAGRLEHFRDAGYTGLELMPISAFPGARNWGYDGTLPFAIADTYGSPDDLRALVDKAHRLGIGIVVDVVYNHFGSVDNFVPRYAPEWFDRDARTPWGASVDVRQQAVREFYYENARMWLADYDVDGLRFDAVHEIRTEARDLFLGELTGVCRAIKPDAWLLSENVYNEAHWLTRSADGSPVDFTAQWSDDLHHVLEFLVTGRSARGYQEPGRDAIADFEKALADGFVHDGDAPGYSDGRTRGEPASELPPDCFVIFIQNHDQIGNRPDGQRIVDRVDAERLDFGHFVLLMSPQIPLFFMGEEAHLRRSFPFFFDMPVAAAEEKRAARYGEMAGIFNEKVAPGDLPDPQDEATFAAARLGWSAYGRPEHRAALARFRELNAIRRERIWPLLRSPSGDTRSARQGDGLIVTWNFGRGSWTMALNPTGNPVTLNCETGDVAASTGEHRIEARRLNLGSWSAVVWPGPGA